MTSVAISMLKGVCLMISICLYLSPTVRMRRVILNKDTGETPLLPLVTMICNYYCWMSHGLFIGDYFPLAATTSLGFVLGSIYTAIFVYYTSDRASAFKICGVAFSILGAITLYDLLAWQGVIFHQTNRDIGQVLGYCAVVATFAFFSSPLATIRKVLRTKSSESLIIQMVFMATSNNLFWSTYAAIVGNVFLLVPNSICFCFGLLEIYLCYKYPGDKRYQPLATTEKEDVAINIETPSEMQTEEVVEYQSRSELTI